MRIDGQWLVCDDGVRRPVISGEILADNGSWEKSEFLVDTGTDRTVFSAATLARLGLQPLVMQEGISGVGGLAEAVTVAQPRSVSRVKRLARSCSEGSMPQSPDWKRSISASWDVTSPVCSLSLLTGSRRSFVCWGSAIATASSRTEAIS